MFTGLIKEIGQVTDIKEIQEGRQLTIRCPKLISEIKIDDSVAVNGTCLTAIHIKDQSFSAIAVHTTLEKTGLGALKSGSPVNLELALRAMDRLGGHFVQGHVNTQATLKKVSHQGENWDLWWEVPKKFSHYFISEGSVALDGISLTIAEVKQNQFRVTIIPHTWANTILNKKSIGEKANLEVDVLAKYFFAYFGRLSKGKDPIDHSKLQQWGIL